MHVMHWKGQTQCVAQYVSIWFSECVCVCVCVCVSVQTVKKLYGPVQMHSCVCTGPYIFFTLCTLTHTHTHTHTQCPIQIFNRCVLMTPTPSNGQTLTHIRDHSRVYKNDGEVLCIVPLIV